jgi:predicted esterase YcpF (UPF0227 family)
MNHSNLFVIYLHGFLSSPQSKKAQQVIAYCEKNGLNDRLLVPALHSGPAIALLQVQQLIDAHKGENVGLIGSSLGGYYATCLAQMNNLKAVVINPAVRPYDRWQEHIGEHENYYSGNIHEVTQEHVAELEKTDSDVLSYPQNYMLLAQTGDEVCDYRLAEDRYLEGTCIVQEGGNHSFENFAVFLPLIFDFLSIKN